ncbi:MAG: AAA family ATPase [Candidatus Heimdallarchaeota archaeon]|nr:AAA family ATPase [Candidatus Heimdallarchaeota archaeon]MCK4877453.1 AAA family ATPase [Candidatus Heimdallarchaeota archaeon]
MTHTERISSGMEGLDVLLQGGLIKNSINSIVGSSGTGKTTFALSYVYQGLLEGDHILYLSFEETPSKLMAEAESLGIKIKEIAKNYNDLIHLVESEKIVEFMTNILPALAQKLKYKNVKHTRIILDPLTPILWEFPSEKDQRKVLTKIYHHLSSLGTVLQTIEEPNAFGQTDIGAVETRVPIYLSDSVIHIQNLGLGGKYNRTCKIIKSRRTAHHEGIYPLKFAYGQGIKIDTSSIAEVITDTKANDVRYLELKKKIKEMSKDKDPKKQIIAQIANNLLGEREKREGKENIELVNVLTDPQILQEVKR